MMFHSKSDIALEVECVKYRERMDSEQAECRHPGDYCKFRSSCIIHFLGGEKKNEGAGPSGTEAGTPGAREESEKQ
jgi:hypothetical protein